MMKMTLSQKGFQNFQQSLPFAQIISQFMRIIITEMAKTQEKWFLASQIYAMTAQIISMTH
jgi:hypothetical protein